MSDSFTDLLVHNLSISAPPLPHACFVPPLPGGHYGGLSRRASPQRNHLAVAPLLHVPLVCERPLVSSH